MTAFITKSLRDFPSEEKNTQNHWQQNRFNYKLQKALKKNNQKTPFWRPFF